MMDLIERVNSPLFSGIKTEDLKAMLGCIGYHSKVICMVQYWEISLAVRMSSTWGINQKSSLCSHLVQPLLMIRL